MAVSPISLRSSTRRSARPRPAFHPPPRNWLARFSFGRDAAIELVFVNGHFDPRIVAHQPASAGRARDSFADALADERPPCLEQHLGQYADIEKNPFVALNTGFIQDGARIYIPRGTALSSIRSICCLFPRHGDEPTVSHPRLLIVADNGSQCTVVESYVGEGHGAYFTNAVTEIVAGSDALIDHCKLQQEGRDACHVATMQVQLGRGAKFVSHSASLGARLTRNDLNVVMNGEGADATLNGLVLIGGNAARRQSHAARSRLPELPEPRALQACARRQISRRFQGKNPRPPGRPENRFQADQQDAACSATMR